MRVTLYRTNAKNRSFKQELVYKENLKNYNSQKRKCKIIWFNPPVCRFTKINIGRFFLKLIDTHLNDKYPLTNSFNRKTLKIF